MTPWWMRTLAWLGHRHYMKPAWRFWVLDSDHSASGPYATAEDALSKMTRHSVLVEVRLIPVVWDEHIGTVPSSTWVPRLDKGEPQ